MWLVTIPFSQNKNSAAGRRRERERGRYEDEVTVLSTPRRLSLAEPLKFILNEEQKAQCILNTRN
jgi:hypothetical protein